MKRLFIFLVVLLCMEIAFAGETTRLDFINEPKIAVVMDKGDQVKFELLGGEHAVVVKDIGKDSVKFSVFPFSGNAVYAFVQKNYFSYVDLDRNGIDDIKISLYQMRSDGRATIFFERVNQENVVEDDSEQSHFDSRFIWLIWLLALGVISYLFLFKKKK